MAQLAKSELYITQDLFLENRRLESQVRRKRSCLVRRGGVGKAVIFLTQLAGLLPYVKYGSSEQSGGVTSPADFNAESTRCDFFLGGKGDSGQAVKLRRARIDRNNGQIEQK